MAFRERTLEIKTPEQIAKMRVAGLLVGETLELLRTSVRAGITTGQLDAIAEENIRSHGGIPSFLGYGHPPFSGTICASVNEEVVHGVPGERVLVDGDVISIDCGAIVDGWHGDAARTFVVGEPPAEVSALVETTRLAMMAGIAAAVPGNRIGDISAAIEDVATPGGYGIVRQFVGHGIGTEMHQEPQVPNYRAGPKGMQLVPGICLAIEPMLTLGSHEVGIRPDGWTVVTRDGSLAAHFEHTIAVTEQGPEILTTV
jgi:methionyl aminopeptidase